jgi:D-xylose transport system permease protein
MLVLLIALPLYLVLTTRSLAGFGRNAALLGLALAAISESLLFVFAYTADLEDGSTIGHLDALAQNIRSFATAIVFGDGLGSAGSVPADQGIEIVGGGEGAIFSILFQIGLPGALLFLAFYGVLVVQLYRSRRHDGVEGELAAATCALMVGAASSMVLSEHLLSVSATAPFWLAIGGILSVRTRQQRGAA